VPGRKLQSDSVLIAADIDGAVEPEQNLHTLPTVVELNGTTIHIELLEFSARQSEANLDRTLCDRVHDHDFVMAFDRPKISDEAIHRVDGAEHRRGVNARHHDRWWMSQDGTGDCREGGDTAEEFANHCCRS
jgi:hypothetical protein